MDFFRPNFNSGDTKNNTKMTGANITKGTEERLQNLKEKRKERREKINEKSSYFSKDKKFEYFNETEALRKDKSLNRSGYQKKERYYMNRLGINDNNSANNDFNNEDE